jgi:hypothetical protein
MHHLCRDVRVVGLSRLPPLTFRASPRCVWGSISPHWSVQLVGLSDNTLTLTSSSKTSRQFAALLRARWLRCPCRNMCIVPDLRRAGSPLLGLQRSPLHRHTHCASTPRQPLGPCSTSSEEFASHVPRWWLPFDINVPTFMFVPSLPFLTASTVFSAHRAAGLLHPAADHGVRQVVCPNRWSAVSVRFLSGPCRPPHTPSSVCRSHCCLRCSRW